MQTTGVPIGCAWDKYGLCFNKLSMFFFITNSVILNSSVTSALYGYQHSFGQGTGPVYLYGVWCAGTESSLLSCSHSGISFNWCSDAGVVCPCRLDVYSWLLDVQVINSDCISTQLIYALISNSLGYLRTGMRQSQTL